MLPLTYPFLISGTQTFIFVQEARLLGAMEIICITREVCRNARANLKHIVKVNNRHLAHSLSERLKLFSVFFGILQRKEELDRAR